MIPASVLRVFLLGVGLSWLGLALVVWRMRRKARWRLGPDAPADRPIPRLAVVIPARNEAKNIAACVASVLASDHGNLEVTVFDDDSDDDTAVLARQAGARVIRGTAPPPAGWVGKPWALWQATQGIEADWILFLDADVRLHPAAASRTHTYALRQGIDLLSGVGTLTREGFWEKVLHSLTGAFVVGLARPRRVNDPTKPGRAVAIGQFILVRRSAYEAVGGHQAVRSHFLEDVGLARVFAARGYVVRCLLLRELYSVRMYAGFSAIWQGWTRILFPAMGYRWSRLALACWFVFVWMVFPYAAFARAALVGPGEIFWISAGVVVCIQAVRLWLDRVLRSDWRFGIFQVVGAVVLIALLLDSARRTRYGEVIWKGRGYRFSPQGGTGEPGRGAARKG